MVPAIDHGLLSIHTVAETAALEGQGRIMWDNTQIDLILLLQPFQATAVHAAIAIPFANHSSLATDMCRPLLFPTVTASTVWRNLACIMLFRRADHLQ